MIQIQDCCDICSSTKDVSTYIFSNCIKGLYVNSEVHLCKHCQSSIFKLISKSIVEYKLIYEEVKGISNDRKM